LEVFEFIADVEADDGRPHFRATLNEPFNAITFKPPAIGQRVKVKLHAMDHEAKFDRSDDGTYQHVPGVPDWRRHGDPLKEADEARRSPTLIPTRRRRGGTRSWRNRRARRLPPRWRPGPSPAAPTSRWRKSSS
jgi:hypothetical protein